jgi:hypothetical protein
VETRAEHWEALDAGPLEVNETGHQVDENQSEIGSSLLGGRVRSHAQTQDTRGQKRTQKQRLLDSRVETPDASETPEVGGSRGTAAADGIVYVVCRHGNAQLDPSEVRHS